MKRNIFNVASVCLMTVFTALGQAPAPAPAEDKELKFNLNESGSHYFKATFLNQAWFRYNQSNPGTKVFGSNAPETFDIGLRRTRIQLFGQITDHAFLYFQIGQNNFNFTGQNNTVNSTTSPKQIGFFIHDAVCEFLPFKNDKFKVGGGLTIASGLSRFTQPSVGTILTMDVPVFAQATTGQIDQFSRKLSIYARGQLGKVDYRFIISDPFRADSSLRTEVSSFAFHQHHKQYQTYLFYQFLDKESNTTPYMTGTYLGKKNVFNIGGGAIYQRNAMWYRTAGGEVNYENLMLWAADVYLDKALNKEKETAISAYAGLFFNNYGRNYVRYNGIMNVVTGAANTNGFGNSYPMFGTGQTFYAQLAYLLPKTIPGEGKGKLQPYVTYTLNNFKGLQDPGHIWNGGLNYLLKGHKAKFSLDYQNRPVYALKGTDTKAGVVNRRGQLVLQYQIYL